MSNAQILTTHVGSLPRPQDVVDLIFKKERGEPFDQDIFDQTMRAAVDDVIARQVEVGIDIVSDGEMSKISYQLTLKIVTQVLTVIAPDERRLIWKRSRAF